MSKSEERWEDEPVSTLTALRLGQIVGAYGGDSRRWPSSERSAVLALLERDAELRGLQATEAEFDEILNAMQSVAVPDALRTRILGDFDARRRRHSNALTTRIRSAGATLGHAVWPGAPLWQPMFAVTLSLVLGLTAGALVRPGISWLDTDESVTSSPLDAALPVDPGEAI
jgi:hypothetical protein